MFKIAQVLLERTLTFNSLQPGVLQVTYEYF